VEALAVFDFFVHQDITCLLGEVNFCGNLNVSASAGMWFSYTLMPDNT